MNQLNLRNKCITKNDIIRIFENGGLVDIKPTNINYYQIAMTGGSYAGKNDDYTRLSEIFNIKMKFIDFQEESQERYEFAGDSFINNTVCEYLFERYPNKNEGFLSKLKIKIVSGEYLANFTRYVGLADFILMSNYNESVNGRDTNNILEDAFEAFIFAMINDNIGRENVRQFIINILEEVVDFGKIIFNDKNYKDRLLKFTQKNGTVLKFIINVNLGKGTTTSYYVDCLIDNKKVSSACNKIKKDAEHESSLKAMIKLKFMSMEEQIFIRKNE